MDFLYRNAAPAYKGTKAPPQGRNGLLSGLFCNLLGGRTPSYKTLDERGAQASTPARCWWQAFVTTPSYKTAPPHANGEAATTAESGDGAAELDSECAPDEAPQILIL